MVWPVYRWLAGLCDPLVTAPKRACDTGGVGVTAQQTNLLRGYLWVLMGGLLLQGLGSLLFRLMPAFPAHAPLLVRGAFGIDFWHALIHITWGLVGVVLLGVNRTSRPLI